MKLHYRLLSILQMTFLPKSSTGQTEIVNMITKMADLEAEEEFDSSSTEALDRFIQCASQAMQYFSKSNSSTKYLEYIVMKILPHYYELPELAGVDVQDKLCKLTAELMVTCGKLSDPVTAASNVFDRLIDYMPLPPVSEDGAMAEVPNLEFTKVTTIILFGFNYIENMHCMLNH